MTDIENVITALNLEYGANRRYAYQLEHSIFPQVNNIFEGVRRTESEHVEAMLAYIKARQTNNPTAGRGFATLLTHIRLNLEFEQQALSAYAKFARETEDTTLKQTFQQLARSEAGHINLFKELIAQIEANAFPVIIYCPVCGWEINYGCDVADGTIMKCPMCKQQITVHVQEGDYTARPVDCVQR